MGTGGEKGRTKNILMGQSGRGVLPGHDFAIFELKKISKTLVTLELLRTFEDI